jgi:hypothetical protein
MVKQEISVYDKTFYFGKYEMLPDTIKLVEGKEGRRKKDKRRKTDNN